MHPEKLRVIHYVNQFFGGIGGEDKADVAPEIREGTVGPGRAFQAMLGDRGEVIATAVCGDNYFAEKTEEAAAEIIKLIRSYEPDLLVAGPAFEAGRYGIACGAICKAARDELNIPAVTGMYLGNPGMDLFHKDVYIIRTGNSVRTMNDDVKAIVNLAIKLVDGQKIGKPEEEGYIPLGIILNETTSQTAAERAISMLLHKLRGEPFESEVSLSQYDKLEPAPRIENIAKATIALITDGGLVPKGNPDRIESNGATRFGKYSFVGQQELKAEDYDVNHVGYDPVFVGQDPNRLVPVDVMRELEQEKIIGRLSESFHSTAGVATPVENARKMGKAIAADLKSESISGVILTST